MRIERLNENQIRCTLDKEDLEQRQLVLSELARGSEKAKELLQDLILQASSELGFEVENTPLMIEAIPIANDCLVLVVTKVDDPEVLNSRLSYLSSLLGLMKDDTYESPFFDDEDDDDVFDSIFPENDKDTDTLSLPDLSAGDGQDTETGIDPGLDPLGLLTPFTQALAQARKKSLKKQPDQPEGKDLTRLFIFHDLDQIIRLSAFITPFYTGESDLYKDSAISEYYLFLRHKDYSREELNRACMIASEYGLRTPIPYAAPAYCREHCQLLFRGDALETLNQLN